MRIAIVSTYYPFPPSVGGVETIVRQVAIELAKRGHEVHIVTSNLDVTTQKPVTNLGTEERERVIVHKLKAIWTGIGHARILKGLREKIQEVKPDIVHVHNLHPSLVQLVRWKEDLGYKLVAELHHFIVNLDFLSQRIVLPFALTLLRILGKNIDVFIAHTKLEENWLSSQGIPKTKIRRIFTPAISDKLFSYSTKAGSAKNEEPLVSCISRIVPKKGIHVLIKAFAKVVNKYPETQLVIAGREEPGYSAELRRLIQILKIENHVKFIGYVTEAAKYKLIREARIFSLSTLADYHPIVLLEAQALGTPVVTTKVGAIPEIVLDEGTGILVEPGNVEQLAEAIIKLIEDKELWKRFSIKARKWAKNFTLEKRVDELESLYREVLNRD